MEFFRHIWEMLTNNEVSVPMAQVALLLAINSFCLLFARFKTGLLVSYCFVFYWGFVLNKETLIGIFGETTTALTVYIISGLTILVCAFFGFLQKGD